MPRRHQDHPAPQLKRISVTLRYTSNRSLHTVQTFSNRGEMGRRPPPEEPLLRAIREVARLASFYGLDRNQIAQTWTAGLSQWLSQREVPTKQDKAVLRAQQAYHADPDGDIAGADYV